MIKGNNWKIIKSCLSCLVVRTILPVIIKINSKIPAEAFSVYNFSHKDCVHQM